MSAEMLEYWSLSGRCAQLTTGQRVPKAADASQNNRSKTLRE
jgi:hypothetical protein